FGLNGGRGRCFAFFQDYAACFASADTPKECVKQYEDYQECLYHRKELLRLKLVQEEWVRQKQKQKQQREEEAQAQGAGQSLVGRLLGAVGGGV
ncbi:hypothetical protein HDU82_005477, partial [Entophlyctis luteolus]